MSTEPTLITKELHQYYTHFFVQELPLLKDLREETLKLEKYFMQISPEQGQFMSFLTKIIKAESYLEIGTFTGYSTLSVALALPSNGHVVTCDISKDYTDMARKYWEKANLSHMISLHLRPALETIDELSQAQEKFDLIFIDADKRLIGEYYELCLKLLSDKGVILIDNVFRKGHVADDNIQKKDVKAVRDLNSFIKDDDRVFFSTLPISDGLTLVSKK